MATPITSVSGIGAQTAEILVENGFANAEALAVAKEEDLLKISGFGPSKAKKFIEAAQTLVGVIEDITVKGEPVQADADVVEEVKTVSEKKEGNAENPSGPKVVTQKFCRKKKNKDKPNKSKKKKKKSSRRKKSK